MAVTNTKKWETELHIKEPWKIDDVSLKHSADQGNTAREECHVSLSYKRGSHFADETGTPCPVFDTYNKTWRHIDYDKHRCYVHCKVPRIETTEGKVKQSNIPWARKGSGFTLCFEAYVLHLLTKNQLFNSVCKQLNETPDRILVIFNHWVNAAYLAQHIDQNLDIIGLGEQSSSAENRHSTTLIDLKNQRVLLVMEGKSQENIQQVKIYLENKKIAAAQIKHISGDFFNQAILTELKACFPNTTIHCDRFYVTQHLNDAIEQISNTERKNIKSLAKHRSLLRTDLTHLSTEQKTALLQLTTKFPRIEKAYRLKVLFNDLWEQKSVQDAEAFLASWCLSAEESGLASFKEVAQTLRKHKDNIVNFTTIPTSQTVMGNMHEKIQRIIKSGLRNTENLSNMIYLLCGKLSFPSYPEYTDEDA